jgi:hypothetical protein
MLTEEYKIMENASLKDDDGDDDFHFKWGILTDGNGGLEWMQRVSQGTVVVIAVVTFTSWN